MEIPKTPKQVWIRPTYSAIVAFPWEEDKDEINQSVVSQRLFSRLCMRKLTHWLKQPRYLHLAVLLFILAQSAVLINLKARASGTACWLLFKQSCNRSWITIADCLFRLFGGWLPEERDVIFQLLSFLRF